MKSNRNGSNNKSVRERQVILMQNPQNRDYPTAPTPRLLDQKEPLLFSQEETPFPTAPVPAMT